MTLYNCSFIELGKGKRLTCSNDYVLLCNCMLTYFRKINLQQTSKFKVYITAEYEDTELLLHINLSVLVKNNIHTIGKTLT